MWFKNSTTYKISSYCKHAKNLSGVQSEHLDRVLLYCLCVHDRDKHSNVCSYAIN